MTNNFLPKAYFQGGIVDFKDANVSIATHALHYGTAALGGMRAQPNSKKSGYIDLFRPELHAKRLSDSAKLLGFKIDKSHIMDVFTQFIAANPGKKPYYIRPLVYASDLGVSPRLHDMEYDFLMYGIEMGDYISSDGISCCFSSWARGEDRNMPLRGKISGSYVTSALAKTEAVNRGFDEALMLNTRGKVAEGSAMNIFMVKEGALVTPPVTADILEGITRRSVLEIAENQGIKTIERDIDKSELFLADEVFLTGTAARLASIKRIEQYDLPQQWPVTDTLRNILNDVLSQKLPEYKTWIKSFPSSSKT